MDKKLDYSIRAEKVFISQLLPCLEQTAEMGLSTWVPGRHDKWFMQHPAGEISFQRVWLQGVVVADEPGAESATIDDGTGSIEVCCKAFLKKFSGEGGLKTGAYVLVIGALSVINGRLNVKAAKVKDLSGEANCEANWYLDVLCISSQLHHMHASK
mmetsp:Transcript_24539/g.41042  ORF Transcript_24539/g.41042 Transcript_24539/m.41042 type:complete len:156 (-) Transcript_24539:282-749(-)